MSACCFHSYLFSTITEVLPGSEQSASAPFQDAHFNFIFAISLYLLQVLVFFFELLFV